jgi:hypothetical protein
MDHKPVVDHLRSPNLSIIVPVYNTQVYLKRCLDSLINQSLTNLEIIIVNDGSTDNSQTCIEQYQNLYPQKVRSFIKSNGGLSDARNFGLKYALGEYIAFVDSDDWVDTNLYWHMYNEAVTSGLDIVCCDFIEKYAASDIMRLVRPEANRFNKYLGNMQAWNKIYRRKYWQANNFAFAKGILHEDNELIPKVISQTTKVGYVDDVYYYYEKSNQHSITAGNKLHLQYFPVIIDSLLNWQQTRCPHDKELQIFIAEMAYIYLGEIADIRLARIFFATNYKLFAYHLLPNCQRRLFVTMLKLNFNASFQVKQFIKYLKAKLTA